MQHTAIIIDDEIEICQLLAGFLNRKKFKTYYALNLKEAFLKCEKYLPEVVFLDNNLPDGSGISHIPKFLELNPSLRIVVISAMTNLAEEAISAGAVGFVSKPISFQNIQKYI